jgi:beta-glucosidase
MTISSFEEARLAVASGETVADVARAFVTGLTRQERLWCLDGDAPTWAGLGFMTEHDGYHKAAFVAGQLDRVLFPGIRFADGPRGAVIGNATCFPVSMARGATWDVELEERIGDAVGLELRALGANLTGAVCVNLLRHPAWGRAQETYGEDPHHVGELGASFTRGLQRHVMACVKHFACNSMENARFSVDIEIDDVALHEVFLPHFKRIIDEGVASVMSAYNSVNGSWCGQNHELLTDILREEWGFEGFVISDWVFGLRNAAGSLNAGLDVEMPHRMIRAEHLASALERNEASWADVDRAVERVVATMLRFDRILSLEPPSISVVGSTQHRLLAREAAAKSIVLLRNENVDDAPVLPITDKAARVAVIGRLASTVNVGDGGSSDVWDLHCKTVLDGVKERFADTVYYDGTDLVEAAEIAGGADVAVVVVGYTYLDEGEFIGSADPALGALLPKADEPDTVARYEAMLAGLTDNTKPEHLQGRTRGFSMGGDRNTLRLAPTDVSLIRAVAAANRRTVVAMQAGSAVITTEWAETVPAIVQAWYGGAEAGPGLVDVLVGDVNPSARLPFTVPVDEADLPAFDRDATSFAYDRWHGWWRAERNNIASAYPFGFGLSYTSFALTEVECSAGQAIVTARGFVHNTGQRAGADVVQVYVSLPDPGAPSRLIGFARCVVAAGDQQPFEIVVQRSQLATRQPAPERWRPASGRHTFTIARFVEDPEAVSFEIDL